MVGDVWRAPFGFSDKPGQKVRPCLIMEVASGSVRVAKITSTNLDHRWRCERIVVPGYKKTSWVNFDEQRWMPISDLQEPCKA
ncbi:hypothetical protein ACIBJE_17165 [Micromonospora sp. NPDC050187]|uniref:hypothetical protein n=1 Tax=Micromonospora sp. NPDC050187 TaxID=3364277 RepID=UPI0037B509B8